VSLFVCTGVVEGMNASADSFFSSQGRMDPNFEDRNDGVLDLLLESQPSVSSLEMENFHLFHLAQCSRGAALFAVHVHARVHHKICDPEKHFHHCM
jgi:uridine phosphorylase